MKRDFQIFLIYVKKILNQHAPFRQKYAQENPFQRNNENN